MHIHDAQRDVRTMYIGGFVGQLVSGAIWLASAALATWSGQSQAILALVVGGASIFPLTQLALRASGRPASLPPGHPMRALAIQVAITMPLNLPLVGAATLYKTSWFYPAMMIALGAHYLPFTFLYGMRAFLGLGTVLIVAGLGLGLYVPDAFALGGWITGSMLVVFAFLGRELARDGLSSRSH